MEAGMRGASILIVCLLMALTLAGAGTSLFAADLGDRERVERDDYERDDEDYSNNGLTEREVAELCYSQQYICRKICNLNSRFENDFDGCKTSCGSRAMRCTRTGCYRWSEREFLIAENFGGYRCAPGQRGNFARRY